MMTNVKTALMPQNDLPEWDEKRIPLLELKYSFSHFTGDIQENSHAINYDVEIMYGNMIGEWYQSMVPDKKKCIGHAHLRLIRWERAIRLGDSGYNNGFGGLEGYESVLFNDYIWEKELKPEWAEELKDCPCKNILNVRDLYLDKPYRGKGWGRIIMKQILHSFDGLCGLVMLSPTDERECRFEDSDKKLQPYFESIGFTRIQGYDPHIWGSIPLMYLNMYKPNERLNEIEVYTVCDY